jgi:hypothetical protein
MSWQNLCTEHRRMLIINGVVKPRWYEVLAGRFYWWRQNRLRRYRGKRAVKAWIRSDISQKGRGR